MLNYQICKLTNKLRYANAIILVSNPIDAVNDGPTTAVTAATPTIVQNVTATLR
jgi:hypothetical protein